MAACGVETIDTLHITSWDADHCSASELPDLLAMTRPAKIECPGYEPSSDRGRECRAIIRGYEARLRGSNRAVRLKFITPDYIDGLTAAEAAAFKDVFYNPRSIDPSCPNNNSTVKFFRRGTRPFRSPARGKDPAQPNKARALLALHGSCEPQRPALDVQLPPSRAGMSRSAVRRSNCADRSEALGRPPSLFRAYGTIQRRLPFRMPRRQKARASVGQIRIA
jgi:hypothetical protein